MTPVPFFIAQATQPVTAGDMTDIKLAFAGLVVLVLGAVGISLVAIIKKGGSTIEAMLEAKAARSLAEAAMATGRVAEVKADAAGASAGEAKMIGATNSQNIVNLATQITPPPAGTGGGGLQI